MSYCVYTTTGDYKCTNIEQIDTLSQSLNENMTNISKPTIPVISDYDTEFKSCKSFNPQNKISVLYNTHGYLPDNFKAFKSKKCNTLISKEKLNNDLKINKCYVVSSSSTIAPNSKSAEYIMNSNNYKDSSFDNLFKPISLCNINNNYVVCDKNIVDIATSKLQQKEYCYTGISYNRNQKVG